MTALDPLAGGKVPEKFLNFQRYFFLKMRFWNMPIAFLESINLHQCSDIVNFAIAKDFF